MNTINNLLALAQNTLEPYSATAKLDGQVLLCHALQKDRSWLLAHPENSLTNAQIAIFNTVLKRRTKGEPIAYIVGRKEFYGRDFLVNQHVLVPRPESESFITILQALKTDTSVHGFLHTIIDIGTGSGCLAITIKLEHPDMFVVASDTSNAALRVAIQNASKHSATVVFKKQSLLTNDKDGYDVVCANLPYVPEDMHNDSIAHEPKQALFSGSDGLNHYKRLFKQLAKKHIRFVMTESLVSQHNEVTELAGKAGYALKNTDGLVQLFAKTARP